MGIRAQLNGHFHQRRQGPGDHLFHYVSSMKLDCLFPDIQQGSYLFVEHPCYDMLHHLTLTGRERVVTFP